MIEDINMEAHEQRSHQLAVVRAVCRWSFLILVSLIGACAYRCDPEVRRARFDADKRDNYWRGRAEECERWTK